MKIRVLELKDGSEGYIEWFEDKKEKGKMVHLYYKRKLKTLPDYLHYVVG